MPDSVFQLVLPLYAIGAMTALVLRRRSVRRRTGVDPLVLRPHHRADSVASYVERTLTVGTVALNLDILLNAVAPPAVARTLGVAVLRQSVTAGAVGLVAMIGGLALCLLGIWGMGASWRVGVDRQHPGPLVTTGIYARVRHPIYTGIMLMACGQAAVTADAISIAVAAAALVGLPVQARLEEDFLAERFGVAYTEYRERTRRF